MDAKNGRGKDELRKRRETDYGKAVRYALNLSTTEVKSQTSC